METLNPYISATHFDLDNPRTWGLSIGPYLPEYIGRISGTLTFFFCSTVFDNPTKTYKKSRSLVPSSSVMDSKIGSFVCSCVSTRLYCHLKIITIHFFQKSLRLLWRYPALTFCGLSVQHGFILCIVSVCTRIWLHRAFLLVQPAFSVMHDGKGGRYAINLFTIWGSKVHSMLIPLCCIGAWLYRHFIFVASINVFLEIC